VSVSDRGVSVRSTLNISCMSFYSLFSCMITLADLRSASDMHIQWSPLCVRQLDNEPMR
jgi:hypothetical protein